jgi:hypothetical protein
LSDENIDLYFKPSGPTDTKLFSNVNIDNVLKHFELAFPFFYHIDFLMNDWEKAPSDHPIHDLVADKKEMCKLYKKDSNTFGGESIKSIDELVNKVKNEQKTCYGCVFNIDFYSGPGTHWVAMFIDLRDRENATIEYFNSSGNKPPANFAKLMKLLKERLEVCLPNYIKIEPVTDKEVQKSETECGPYSVFYIYERLKGTPYKHFNGLDYDRVKDKSVTMFRKYIFYTKPEPEDSAIDK